MKGVIMSDKPWADRLNEEVESFSRLWHDRRWLAIIFILILIGVLIYSGIGWFQSRTKIDELESTISDLKTDNRELKRDLRQAESEVTSLRDVVAPLINQAVEEFPSKKIYDALKIIIDRLEKENPLKKPIASATSTVEIVIQSDQKINQHYMDSGGYLAFAKGTKTILTTSASNSWARQTGNGEVVYRGVFQMPATNSAVGKPIEFLESAEYLQILFYQIPKNSSVIIGKAIIVLT